MKFYLLHPDDRERWEITPEEPQSAYSYKKTTVPRIEPQVIEHPAPPYRELTEDEVIEIVLEAEQVGVDFGLGLLPDTVTIQILDDLVTLYDHLKALKEIAQRTVGVTITFADRIEAVTIESDWYFDGKPHYIITINSTDKHREAFGKALAAAFEEQDQVEIEYGNRKAGAI